MMDESSNGASSKERARKQRQEAYRRAKEARDRDPRYLAMKQAAKEQRRQAYRTAKERLKAVAAEEKARTEIRRVEQRAAERAATDGALMKLLQKGTKWS
jgi:hypothetical protein